MDLDSLFNEWTAQVAEGGVKDMKRTTHDVRLEPEMCRPGVFPEGFTITIQELSTGEEMACMREAKGNDPALLALSMTMRSMRDFNGERIRKKAHREWLWEALGQRGRNHVALAYSKHILGDESTEDEEGNG